MPAAQPARKRTSTAKSSKPDFAPVFSALRQIIERFSSELKVIVDKPVDYQVVIPTVIHRGRPLFLAAVRSGKSYVSFHLLPLYYNPAMLKELSPGLKKRMQGKACFNFTAVDKECFAELEKLMAAGLKRFKSKEFLQYLEKLQ
jgi:hypothetical protein